MNKIKELYNVYYCMWCGKPLEALPIDGKCPICHQDRFRFIERYVESDPHNVQLIKISSANVINNMRAGNLWFQSPHCFNEYQGDGEKVRKDIHDSRYSSIDENAYVEDKNVDTYRLLCFYALKVDTDGNFLETPNNELKEFGAFYSIVDIETLLVRLKTYLSSLNEEVNYIANWVNYLGDSYSGAYSPFSKFPKDSYQNEFRIVLISNTFLSYGKDPYKTSQLMADLSEVFSEPQPLDNLLFGKNLNDL